MSSAIRTTRVPAIAVTRKGPSAACFLLIPNLRIRLQECISGSRKMDALLPKKDPERAGLPRPWCAGFAARLRQPYAKPSITERYVEKLAQPRARLLELLFH